MKQHATIFGDLTPDEIKAKLQARREAKEKPADKPTEPESK